MSRKALPPIFAALVVIMVLPDAYASGAPDVTAACPAWSTTLETVAAIHEPDLTEISGLVASTDQPGVFWLIEDSLNGPYLWAMNGSGDVVGRFELLGARNIDWEDLAIDRQPGTDVIYIPDIGDNNKNANRDGVKRAVPTLYRLLEPTVSATGPRVDLTITDFETFSFRYADEFGTILPPLNAETFMVDPLTHQAFVIEKISHTVGGQNQYWVYQLPDPLSPSTLNLATKVSYITKRTVAADISPDGQTIVAKNYTKGFLWPRAGTVDQTLDAAPAPPCKFAPVDRAEALAYASDGLWMIAEGVSSPIHRLAPAA